MMKNLFKNLMLVAVAAMAFTACQKDNGELDAPKRIVNFTANIGGDDTRSGFTGKGDNGYKSAWDGDETLIVKAENTEKWPTIDAEGKFSVEFSAGDQFATFYSPVASWEYNTSYGIYTHVVPATQTPRANSVDPAAHILQAQNVLLSDLENIPVTFEHVVAYGKMTVNTPAGFDISKVEINLVGAYYGVEKDLTYTINADNVENNVFWFATDVIKVSEMTVTAYGKEGETDKIYSKTVTVAADKLVFDYGRVGSFSVSNLVEYEEPAAPAFTSAAYNGNSSDKIVKLYSDQLGELWINFYGSNSLLTTENWINPGTYGKGNGLYFGGNYGQYKPAGYSQFLTGTPNSFTLDVSIIDGKYKFVINADYGNMYEGVVLENATFFGEIPGLGIPDYRTKLATPAPSYEKDGMTATVSWEGVDGAVGYRVYYTNGGGFDTTTAETSITLEFTQYGEYYVNVIALAADDDPNYKDSDNGYVYLLIEDPRPYLPAPTNVTATVDGAYATISWDPVEGADGYKLHYYLDGDNDIIVEETSYTMYVGFNVSNLWVYVFSVADDDNPDYRSSNSWDAYVIVNTGKDPSTLISLSTMSTGASHSYGYGYTFTNDNDTNFTIVFSDWIATSSSINPGTYNVVTGVSYVNQVNVALDASKTYKFEGVSSKLSSGTISVAKDGETYTIEMSLVLNNGTALDYKYVGSLGGNSSEGGETPDPENPGEGGETPDPGEGGETSTWSFTPSLEGGMMSRYCTFIFTGDDGDTISSYFVYPNMGQVVGTYTVSTLNSLDATNYHMSEIRLNGIYATSGSGSVTISLTNDGGYLFELDLVLNGKTYKGSAVL